MSAPITSDQGFTRFEPIESASEGSVEVYDSSETTEPHLWLHVTGAAGTEEVTAHLTLMSASILRDQLTYLIDKARKRV